MAEVEIKASHLIRPTEKTWTGTMALSEFDMLVARAVVPKLYLYRANQYWDAASIFRTLRESLGKALVHFYPFLGRLRQLEGGRLELVVDDQDEATWGVPLAEAGIDLEVPDLGDLAEAEEKGRLRCLFSMVDYKGPIEEMPMLTVKLTHFRCGGVAVAISWSHAVVDGFGAGHFYTEWTRLARGEPLGSSPVHDRSLLRAGEPPRDAPQFIEQGEAPLAPPTPMLPQPIINDSRADEPPPPIPPITALKLPVSISQINNLKQISGNATNGRPYTRFEVLTAHVWRCASKAKGHEGQKLNSLSFNLDIRRRMNPPLPREFNGNAVLLLTATSESNDLNSNSLGYACERIRQAIDKFNDNLVWGFLDYQKSSENLAWRGTITPEGLLVTPDMIIASWLNLSFNNLDFGWGNEALMATAPQAGEGVTYLLADSEEGSVNVLVFLQVAHVGKFKDYFYHCLK